MKIFEKAVEVLRSGYICDSCLGRIVAGQLLSGLSNEERGKNLRNYLAMSVDSGERLQIDESNFYDIKFHNVKVKPKRPGKCSVCRDIFKELGKKVKGIAKSLRGYNFKTLLVGCVPPSDLIENEAELWNKIGIEFCEPIKSEINRELGKKLCMFMKKDMDRKNADITILYDVAKNKVSFIVRSIFVYGKYQKLVRGIPQSTWKSRIYPTSVQSIIAKPLLKQTSGEGTSFHGSGREDVDVRCLGWRPFVIEIINPRRRELNLSKVKKMVNSSKKVKVKDLKIVNKLAVKRLKTERCDKTYRARVEFENPVQDLKRVKTLVDSVILQQTPKRVLKRRVDKMRKRKVKDIKYKILSINKVQFMIKTQAGTYVKELIHGDEGRTKPSIAEVLSNNVKGIELDVVKISIGKSRK